MKSVDEMTQAEIGAFVNSHLWKKGIQVVLSGGAAVSLHSGGSYISLDLDMVNVHSVRFSRIRSAMEELGFVEKARYFEHSETEFFVEFPPGPLTIGEEPVKQIVDIELSTGILRVISPTDSVKDRLAAYFHWGDLQSLEQAILVAQESEVDLAEVRRWSEAEGKLVAFELIVERF